MSMQITSAIFRIFSVLAFEEFPLEHQLNITYVHEVKQPELFRSFDR